MRAGAFTMAPNNQTAHDSARLRETVVEHLWEFHDIPLAPCERVADELVRRGLAALPATVKEAPAP
ncbi:MAG: hypothetical protein ACREKH_02240 [Candidatus Rokuibacteriota bacterium]